MKLLILCENYPNLEGGRAMAFAHTRNLAYSQAGINVEVLNFSSKLDYVIDGVNVYSVSSIKNKDINEYDIVVSHAPNIRNHLPFLLKHIRSIKNLVFFFHGHEVLKINAVYSKPYDFIKESGIRVTFQNIYDELKFFLLRIFISFYYKKIFFVFVSSWMKEQFFHWIHPNESFVRGRNAITYNSVSSVFEKMSYTYSSPKEYDYITIRSNLDGSKYAIDIVNDLAKSNPNNKFLVIGKGDFFNHYSKADNITWLNCTLKQSEMIEWMNKSRCALMPTRTDAQGVMMCEMEAFGMPVITSDIPVCHEVFDGFENVGFIKNEKTDIQLSPIYNRISPFHGKHEKYFLKNTSAREIALFKSLDDNKNI